MRALKRYKFDYNNNYALKTYQYGSNSLQFFVFQQNLGDNILKINPPNGPPSGNTLITIYGQDFPNTQIVY